MTISALSGDAPDHRLRERPRAEAVRVGAGWAIIATSTACWVFVAVTTLPSNPWSVTPWMLMYAVTIVVAATVTARRPRHPLALWLAGGTLVTVFEVAIAGLRASLEAGAPGGTVALWNLAQGWLYLVPAIASARILGLFADGVVRHRYERVVLGLTWLFLLVPVVLFTAGATVILPFYVESESPVANPFANPFFSIDPRIGGSVQETAGPAVVMVGAVLLVIRYRRADVRVRRPMRWILLPVVLLPIPLVTQAVVPSQMSALVTLAWGAVIVSFTIAMGLGILQPAGLNVDRIVRGTLLYGALWAVIAIVFVVVATIVGTTAGAFLPVSWAVVIAMLVAVVFQPVRTRLERLADRWVFGTHTDPAQLVVGLGASLAQTYDLDALLPRMRATLEDGMGLQWARVRLLHGAERESDASRRAALITPIEVDGELVGLIECGPKTSGHLSGEDVAIIETFARQAGMAVRNVRLKEELTTQAELLRDSRARLVRAQEQERRRIERNIHDGVQQDLTALIGLVGHARQVHSDDMESVREDLEKTQDGLRRVLTDLRTLAQGIHPSVLSDRGLLAAVEALAGRHPVATTVRADPLLRSLRLPDDVEGAAYFTVAEALANALKHGASDRIEVALRLDGTTLIVSARDDGIGFDPTRAAGSGLQNLGERVAAVGGRLDVRASPGAGALVTAEFPLPEDGGAR